MSHETGGHDPQERHLREAAGWLMKLQQPNVSTRQLQRWSQWEDSPENRAAMDSLEPIFRALQPPRERREPDRPTAATKAAKAEHQPRPDRTLKRLRLVSEEAAYWYFLCVDDPGMLRSDRREFLAWMRRSPENISELFRIAQLDGKLRRLRLAMRSLGLKKSNVVELTTTGSPHRLHREIEELPVDQRTFSFKRVAFSASLCFGVVLAFVAQDYMQSEQVVTTGASQWHHMTLPDGTNVHIDARSKIEVEYTDTNRIVLVRQGSAVFEVAKDPKRPFIARTKLIDAVAVGTRFGVSLDPGVTTTVSEGVVKITSRGKAKDKEVTLEAGEELRVSDDSLTSPHIEQVDAERKLQWTNGLLVLDGMTVAEGAEQLNRRNRTQIVVDDPELGAKVVAFASVKVDAPERYARIVASEPGVKMILDRQNGVIRLSE